MRGVLLWGVLASLVGCTKPNPRACSDGECSDPAFPFCDTQGTLGGDKNECIPVTCTPGEIAECRGNTSVVCNASGADYDVRDCVNGCDVEVGCVVEPSNGLGEFLDIVETQADLVLETGTIDTFTGAISGGTNVPTFLLPAPAGGSAIRVYIARRVTLGDVVVTSSNSTSSPALAVVARDEITITGLVTAVGSTSVLAPGAISGSPCDSGIGLRATDGATLVVVAGSGGGGFGTPGASGGTAQMAPLPNGPEPIPGGMGGTANGNDELVPLRGGCAAGLYMADGGGRGGGALQFTSLTAVRVNGRLDVRGQNGAHDLPNSDNAYVTGGGSGGAILLEAPSVELGAAARLLANGGAGASGESDGQAIELGAAPGGACTSSWCGAGGNGAFPSLNATAGADATYVSGQMRTTAGGGGGGMGRIRINTDSGMYARGANAVENGALTTGVVVR